MKKTLEDYQSGSSQSINQRKSKLFIGKCSSSLKRQILGITNLQEKPHHPKYLGSPLIIGTLKKHHFSLLDRFRSKLSVWKSRLLSFTGRIVLVRHVLSSLATHIALIFPLPKSVSILMESFMCNFLWSSAPIKLKRNQIKWKVVYLPT